MGSEDQFVGRGRLRHPLHKSQAVQEHIDAPILAAIPIVLVAMLLGSSVLAWAVVTYMVIQSVEGYLIGPLVPRRAVAAPPAWTLGRYSVAGLSSGHGHRPSDAAGCGRWRRRKGLRLSKATRGQLRPCQSGTGSGTELSKTSI